MNIYEVPVFDGRSKEWRVLNINTGTVYTMTYDTFDQAYHSIKDGKMRGNNMTTKRLTPEILHRRISATNNNKEFLGEYNPGDKITIHFLHYEEGWPDEQEKWLKTHVGQILEGEIVELDGSNYFKPNNTNCVLTDDEIRILA